MGQVETRITKLVRLCCNSCSLNSKHLTIIAECIGPTVDRGPIWPTAEVFLSPFRDVRPGARCLPCLAATAWQGGLFYIALLARRDDPAGDGYRAEKSCVQRCSLLKAWAGAAKSDLSASADAHAFLSLKKKRQIHTLMPLRYSQRQREVPLPSLIGPCCC